MGTFVETVRFVLVENYLVILGVFLGLPAALFIARMVWNMTIGAQRERARARNAAQTVAGGRKGALLEDARRAMEAQRYDDAARIFEKAGELQRAATAWEWAGEEERAARILAQLGQHDRAARIRGERPAPARA